MKKKILLVDDKSTIGKVAGVYLGKEYDFTYLEDPIKAIEWLNEGRGSRRLYPETIQPFGTQNPNQKDY